VYLVVWSRFKRWNEGIFKGFEQARPPLKVAQMGGRCGAPLKELAMRADIVTLSEQITASVGLLRRRL
jgi:hypothetical protein